jgi:hypothetical protein
VLIPLGTGAWHGGQAASERALKERCSERAAYAGQGRLLKRQLSFPVSMMSQWCVKRSSKALVNLGIYKSTRPFAKGKIGRDDA